MPIPTYMYYSAANYSAAKYSAGKYSVWNNFGGKEPWSNDVCALLVMLMLVYYILEHRIRKSVRQLATMINTAQYSAEKGRADFDEINHVNQETLDTILFQLDSVRREANQRSDALQERLKRLEALEDSFHELVKTESAVLKLEAIRLRAHLEKGGLWGKQRQELQAQVDEAARREAAWAKAFEN